MPLLLKADQESIPLCIDILRKGGVIVFPTETAYGLGVDATNPTALERIYQIKGRPAHNPLSVAVANVAMAKRYGHFSMDAEKIAHAFLPGPLTIIVPSTGVLFDKHASGKETVGFRIPDYPWLLMLLTAFDAPITATSANASGKGACYSVEAVRESLGEMWKEIDAVVDVGEIPRAPVSTIVDMTGTEPLIRREGPISGEDIKNVLK